MKLYLVRHGQTKMNVDRVYYGWTDCPLNQQGIEQAKDLKRMFQTIPYDKIIVSDLDRAIATAEIINSEKQKPIVKNKAFRELHFGQWEGKSTQEVSDNYPKDYEVMKKDWLGYAFPKGESFYTFYDRVVTAYAELIDSEPADSTLTMVCHNGVISAILCYVSGAGIQGFWKFISEQGTYSLIDIIDGDAIIRKINYVS